ncbi:MAG: BREX-1 system adenine-specific DNA-methyltransferase PglX [Chromatiales bacterium]|nr:BREX-1 system adenine-specific DNA-methyltransferase PglX [Chromatiales bacterium]
MNLSALKSFAPAVRRQLIEAVGRKLDVVLTGDTADLRAARVQVEKLRQQAKVDRQGLVERVAYTWFNRLSALRLLDARAGIRSAPGCRRQPRRRRRSRSCSSSLAPGRCPPNWRR